MFALFTPPTAFTKMNRSCGCWYRPSNVLLEIVTGPNGEPPGGGLKMPCTTNVRDAPLGTTARIGEPTLRSLSFAKVLSMNAPSAPRVSNVACPGPAIQFSFRTRLPPGVIAVRLWVAPNIRMSASRTPTTAVDTFAARIGFSVAIGIGSKLFCAVTA